MRYFLIASILVVVVVSVFLSVAMMSIPDGSLLGLNTQWLQNTNFKDYLFPGLILFLIVGFPSLSALYANVKMHSKRYLWSVFAGIAICIESIIQGLYIKELFWMNTMMLLIGLMIIATAFQLRGKTMI